MPRKTKLSGGTKIKKTRKLAGGAGDDVNISVTDVALAIKAADDLQKHKNSSASVLDREMTRVKDLTGSRISQSCNALPVNPKTGELQNWWSMKAREARDLYDKFKAAGKEDEFLKFFPVVDEDGSREPVATPDGLCVVNDPRIIRKIVEFEKSADLAENAVLELMGKVAVQKTQLSRTLARRTDPSAIPRGKLEELTQLHLDKTLGTWQSRTKPSRGSMGCDPSSEHRWQEALGSPQHPNAELMMDPTKGPWNWEKTKNRWIRGFEMETKPARADKVGFCASALDERVPGYKIGGVTVYPGVKEYVNEVLPRASAGEFAFDSSDSPDEMIQEAYQCAPLTTEADCSGNNTKNSPMGGKFTPKYNCQWGSDPRRPKVDAAKKCYPRAIYNEVMALQGFEGDQVSVPDKAVKENKLVDWYLNTIVPEYKASAMAAHKRIRKLSKSHKEEDQVEAERLRQAFGHVSPELSYPGVKGKSLNQSLQDVEDSVARIRSVADSNRLMGGSEAQEDYLPRDKAPKYGY